jgi:hypothetical protein
VGRRVGAELVRGVDQPWWPGSAVWDTARWSLTDF